MLQNGQILEALKKALDKMKIPDATSWIQEVVPRKLTLGKNVGILQETREIAVLALLDFWKAFQMCVPSGLSIPRKNRTPILFLFFLLQIYRYIAYRYHIHKAQEGFEFFFPRTLLFPKDTRDTRDIHRKTQSINLKT